MYNLKKQTNKQKQLNKLIGKEIRLFWLPEIRVVGEGIGRRGQRYKFPVRRQISTSEVMCSTYTYICIKGYNL